MLVKVKQSFRDKHTGERHISGTTLEVTEERLKEILQKGKLVEEIDNKVTGHLDSEELGKWKIGDLRKLAKDMGLDAAGKKEELIERICKEPVEAEDNQGEEKEEAQGHEESEN